MEKEFKKTIKNYLQELDLLGKHCYKELEIAIVLYLRSDYLCFDDLSDEQLNTLCNYCDSVSSLLDLDKDEVDYIIENED